MPGKVHRWQSFLSILSIMLIVAALLPSAAYAQTGAQHVVSPGENLFRIALRYGVTVAAIANPHGITDTTQIFPGQVLFIPTAETAPAVEAPAQTDPASAADTANTAGPAAPAPVAATDNGYYVVQPGDTLNRVARRFNVTLAELMSLNGIYDANYIVIGQRLLIPGQAPAVAAPADQAVAAAAVDPVNPADPSAPAAPAQPEQTHVVQRGERLSSIAQRYGITWVALASYNNVPNPDLIYAGMVLRIPPVDYQPAAAGGPLSVASTYDAPQVDGKAILVILSEQRVYAYESGVLLRTSLASTGLAGTPTVTGVFRIYVKYRAQTMSGPGYYLPGVPWVMYFYRGYGIHGTYWHSNFGRPMSHGCVNLPTPEAEWFYNWAEVGTPVYVRW